MKYLMHSQPALVRATLNYGAGTPVKVTNMLWTIFVILLVLWLLGFSFHIAGSLIHLLLVVAVVVLVINLLSGRRAV